MNFFQGAVAQLGERHVRNVEVVGSIPIGSTIFKGPAANAAGPFCLECTGHTGQSLNGPVTNG